MSIGCLALAWCLLLPFGEAAVDGPLLYNIFPHPGDSCEVEVVQQPVAQSGCSSTSSSYAVVMSLNVRNTGNESIAVPYTLSLRNFGYEGADSQLNIALITTSAQSGWLRGTVSSPLLTLGAHGSSQATLGLTVQATSNDTIPARILLNDTPCTILVQEANDPANVPQEFAQYLTTAGGEIIGVDGRPLDLKGIAWFGFDDGNTMVDGLWLPDGPTNYPSGLRMELTTVLQRIQLLGFNAIRVPFSFTDLFTLGPRNFTKNCTHVTDAELLNSVTPPDVAIISDNASLPDAEVALIGLPAPEYSPHGLCNTMVPNTSTLERFVWFIEYLAKQEFYVVLVNQFNSDEIFLESPMQWLQSWRWLMERLQTTSGVFPRLIIDPVNEPETQSVYWEDNAALGRPGLKTLYLDVMDMLFDMEPHLLFFVQGTGQSAANLVTSSGDGFVTDPAVLASHPNASDPNPFFRALLEKPYLGQVVVAPHTYPPSISGNQFWKNYTSTALWMKFSQSFGYLNSGQGYCSNFTGKCHRFPVVLGETGSKFESIADIDTMYDLAEYMHNIGDAEDGKHSRIGSWFWWAWNANAGDTGGIVGDDWEEIMWDKIEFLQYLGLRPWYMGPPEVPEILLGKNSTYTDDVPDNPPRPAFTIVAPPDCTDQAPDNVYTCADQKSFGKCNAGFIVSGQYCLATCGRCAENQTSITTTSQVGANEQPPFSAASPVPTPGGVPLSAPVAAPGATEAPTSAVQAAALLKDFPSNATSKIAGEKTRLAQQAQDRKAHAPALSPGSTPLSKVTKAAVEVGGCSVLGLAGIPWQVGADLRVGVSLRVNLTSGRLQAPWSLHVTNPHYNAVVQSFNWQVTSAASGAVSGIASGRPSDMDASAGEGATVAMIVQVTSSTDLAPVTATLNRSLKCIVIQPICSLAAQAPSPAQYTNQTSLQFTTIG